MELTQNNKTCCFFGHREVMHNIKKILTDTIENLIVNKNVNNFYVGNQGQFDSMVYTVLKELKEKYPHIKYSVVLAYLPNKITAEIYGDDTLYPDGLEFVPKRFEISKRNEWMIKKSAYVIYYVHKITGSAAKFRDKAVKKGCTVINIANFTDK